MLFQSQLEQWLENDEEGDQDQKQNDNDDDLKNNENINNNNRIDRNLIYKSLLHCDVSIRMEALEVLCVSKLSTDIPGINQIELLQSILPYWMKLQMSKYRDQFIQLIQKLLLRMKNGCYKIVHDVDKQMQHDKNYKNDKKEDEDNEEDILSILSLISNNNKNNNDCSDDLQSESSTISMFQQWNNILVEHNDQAVMFIILLRLCGM